jgi:hypothetical protein
MYLYGHLSSSGPDAFQRQAATASGLPMESALVAGPSTLPYVAGQSVTSGTVGTKRVGRVASSILFM